MNQPDRPPADVAGLEFLREHQCWELLRSAPVARLGICVDGRPDIFPINHLIDRATIVFRSGAGTKVSAILDNQAVAIEVDGYDAERSVAWSVVAKGHAELINKLHDLLDVNDLPILPWHDSAKDFFVRVIPTSITGRRFPVVDATRWKNALSAAHRAPLE